MEYDRNHAVCPDCDRVYLSTFSNCPECGAENDLYVMAEYLPPSLFEVASAFSKEAMENGRI